MHQDLPLIVDVSHFHLFEASFYFLLNGNHNCRINRNGIYPKFGLENTDSYMVTFNHLI